MIIDKAVTSEKNSPPAEVLSNPALLFLYYRIEQILGIKTGYDALKNLNDYIETTCGSTFINDPAVYDRLLSSRKKIHEISKFITVNETYFFREGIHFDVLLSLLPVLADLKRPVQICCAAVSIGCEAYSIAMLLDYYSKNMPDFEFTVDAFDISGEVLEIANNARYTSNALRNDGIKWKHILDQYLIPCNDSNDENIEYAVLRNIREKVHFFPHNIMRTLERQYDIIFFRNALIYFSSKHRHTVINNLAEALNSNGFLFLGVSEVSSVKHPLLASRFTDEAFYFQKTHVSNVNRHTVVKPKDMPVKTITETREKKHIKPAEPITKQNDLHVNYKEIWDILKIDDGKPNANKVLLALEKENHGSLSGSKVAAAIVYFLNTQDFDRADRLLSHLEKLNSGACVRFLRGEYFYLKNDAEDALKYFQEAAVKDKYFWPAFYRIAVLSSEGNQIRYEYKIKKAIESIELSRNEQPEEKHYECFMGGFSSDYFLRILEKKLT